MTAVQSVDSIAQLNDLFRRQKHAFARNPSPSLKERAERLDAVTGALVGHRAKIHDALRADFSAHPTELADFTEIFSVAGRLQFAKSMLDEWTKPDPRPVNPALYGASSAYMLHQPKGVIGNIAAWNFPYEIGLGPLAEILAAGNHAIVKPSDQNPASAALIKDMLRAAIDEDIVAVAACDLETSRAFSHLPWDHLIYTGNGAIAREVAAAAAGNLVPLTLELGGKNPTIYAPGSITPASVAATLRAKLAKGGQICINADHIYVPHDELAAFIDDARSWFDGEGADFVSSGGATGIINDRHVSRISALLDQAAEAGSEIITLGGSAERNTRVMPLSLVIDPPADSGVMCEEIFGPVLPVIGYRTIDEVIERVASRDRPLGIYLYANDEALKQRILTETHSGGVSFNCVMLHGAQPNLGFGGSGASGYGRHHGIEGFREFSNARAVFDFDETSAALNVLPPYGAVAQAILGGIAGGA